MLSLREKIGQTCQIHGGDLGKMSKEERGAYLENNPVGSIFLGTEIIGKSGGSVEQLQELIAECQGVSRVPLSIAGDLENGAGGAIRGLTAFPNLLAVGAADSAEIAYEYGRWTAVEACKVGFNWAFGPVVDLMFNWLNPVVSIRSLGRSPERVAELACALIRGCQENGLSATAKHFPGDGVDFRDQHFCLTMNSLAEQPWRETFGRVYEECFKVGVHAVMAGHIALPWIERQSAAGRVPLPATTSQRILDGLLREQMGYQGVVVSDALIMAGFRGRATSREDLIIEAFNAGIDVMLWPGDDYFEIMERALEAGRISETRLNQSVERILAMKAQQGAIQTGEGKPSSSESRPEIELSEASTFARTVAESSLTLVENRRGLLPLDPTKTRRVQVLLATPREKGAEDRLQSLLQGLQNRGIEVELHVNGNCLDLRRKEEAGERYDALLAVFELWTHGIKNTMRPTGDMAECMWTIQGLATMEPIIISLGSPYLLNDMPWAETYINAYSPNPHTIRAVERALFGDIPFRGVSPVNTEASWVMTDGLCVEYSMREERKLDELETAGA
jgi:beta-N-acetylhexosaminidase